MELRHVLYAMPFIHFHPFALSYTEHIGRGKSLHLTIKRTEHFSDGTHNKLVHYGWLWPPITILIHGQMTINSVKWMKKSNENCFCPEKHYLCSHCSCFVASSRHLTMTLLEAECGCNSLFMCIWKWKREMAFVSIFSSMYDWQDRNQALGEEQFFCFWVLLTNSRSYFVLLNFS